jgi:hypothetical protein
LIHRFYHTVEVAHKIESFTLLYLAERESKNYHP